MTLFFKAFTWTFVLGALLAFASAVYLSAYFLSAAGRAVSTTGTITRVTEVSQGGSAASAGPATSRSSASRPPAARSGSSRALTASSRRRASA